MKITHVMREVTCSLERERAERGKVKEAEIERGEDDDQDLDIKGEISGELAACKVGGAKISNLREGR